MLKQFPLTYKFFMDRRGRQSYYPEQDSLAARMFRGEINPNEAFSQALMLPLQERKEELKEQQKGKALPRKQQEMRNPNEVFGPPDPLVGRTYRNPFTGKYEDAEAEDRRIEQQTKRLLESMKKSNIPRSGQRMIMREGGPVPYQDCGQVNPNSLAGKTVKASDLGLENLGEVRDIPSYSVTRPEFEAAMNYAATEDEAEIMRQEAMDNLMSIVGKDMRIRPFQPDRYIIKNGKMSQTKMNIPKLSGAYLSSFGFETPYSQRQQALLQRKMIAPETLNPKVKGLINRALIQRLANEED